MTLLTEQLVTSTHKRGGKSPQQARLPLGPSGGPAPASGPPAGQLSSLIQQKTRPLQKTNKKVSAPQKAPKRLSGTSASPLSRGGRGRRPHRPDRPGSPRAGRGAPATAQPGGGRAPASLRRAGRRASRQSSARSARGRSRASPPALPGPLRQQSPARAPGPLPPPPRWRARRSQAPAPATAVAAASPGAQPRSQARSPRVPRSVLPAGPRPRGCGGRGPGQRRCGAERSPAAGTQMAGDGRRQGTAAESSGAARHRLGEKQPAGRAELPEGRAGPAEGPGPRASCCTGGRLPRPPPLFPGTPGRGGDASLFSSEEDNLAWLSCGSLLGQ